jgi:hypothetical protein
MSRFRKPHMTTRSVSLLSGVALLSMFGAGTAHAAPLAASAPEPALIHTGNAYLNHPLGTPSRRVTVATPGSALQFVVTFDSSITGNRHATEIENSIYYDLDALEHIVLAPVTVTIEFASVSTGLGGAATYYNTEPYSQYRSDLTKQAKLSSYDKQALASLPVSATNPVNGAADVNMTLPLLRATGEPGLGNTGDHVDSTIMLNTSLMNLSRHGKQDASKYDLQAVAMHEICEVLGVGGAGDGLTSGQVGPTDLFRYSADGVRSYTTDPTATPYFSIDSGATNLGYYNQDSGGDYGDWDHALNPEAQVQDAFATPGLQLNLDHNEKTALDVVGYQIHY